MTLLRVSATFVALLATIAACQPDGDKGPSAVPEVEQPAPDPWLAEEYAPVQEQAKQLSVDAFLDLYPQPAYVQSLSYDALASSGEMLLRTADSDPDLDSLRDDPRFEQMMAKARKRLGIAGAPAKPNEAPGP